MKIKFFIRNEKDFNKIQSVCLALDGFLSTDDIIELDHTEMDDSKFNLMSFQKLPNKNYLNLNFGEELRLLEMEGTE